MANIKSSAKRVLVSRVRAERNKADKSELKTTIKKFDAAATEGNKENAEAAYKAAVKTVDRAVSKGLLHERAERIILKTGQCGRYLPHCFFIIKILQICKKDINFKRRYIIISMQAGQRTCINETTTFARYIQWPSP